MWSVYHATRVSGSNHRLSILGKSSNSSRVTIKSTSVPGQSTLLNPNSTTVTHLPPIISLDKATRNPLLVALARRHPLRTDPISKDILRNIAAAARLSDLLVAPVNGETKPASLLALAILGRPVVQVAVRHAGAGIRAAGAAPDRGHALGVFLACLAARGCVLVGAGGEVAIVAGGRGAGVAVPGDAVFREASVSRPRVAEAIGADQVGGSALQCLGGGRAGSCGSGSDGLGAVAVDGLGARAVGDPFGGLGLQCDGGGGGR
jgi:hypothetical protein